MRDRIRVLVLCTERVGSTTARLRTADRHA